MLTEPINYDYTASVNFTGFKDVLNDAPSARAVMGRGGLVTTSVVVVVVAALLGRW